MSLSGRAELDNRRDLIAAHHSVDNLGQAPHRVDGHGDNNKKRAGGGDFEDKS